MPTIDEVLDDARRQLSRVSVADLPGELAAGSLLVDIRPIAQRREFGQIPGSLVIERNVLEWRLDPVSEARLPAAVDHDVRVIVVCQEGFASSLAAVSLHDLGLHRATDLVGGVRAWIDAGGSTELPE